MLLRCSGLRQPLHLSSRSCASLLFSPPAALAALLRVVDPLQDLQPVWSAVYTPGRPSRLFGVGGWGAVDSPGAAPPLADLHAHKSLEQPRGHNCQLLPASEHSTQEPTHTLSSSPSVFLLPSIQCTQVQSMLGELMVQVEGVGGGDTAEEGR